MTALAVTTARSAGSAGAKSNKAGARANAKMNLTFWFWGDLDAPGANKWLATAVKAYETEPRTSRSRSSSRPTDTFIETFQTAAAAKSGPDIAAQWATGPVLTQVWAGAITPISDLVPSPRSKNWLNTSENTYDGKVWAMPLYLLGIPWVYNKELLRRPASPARPRSGASSSRLREAARQEHHPVRLR